MKVPILKLHIPSPLLPLYQDQQWAEFQLRVIM